MMNSDGRRSLLLSSFVRFFRLLVLLGRKVRKSIFSCGAQIDQVWITWLQRSVEVRAPFTKLDLKISVDQLGREKSGEVPN
jgi:hypothetical protein